MRSHQDLVCRRLRHRNLLTCARAYSTEELEQAEVDFVDSEEAVKTGRLQDVLSVELLIVKYSTGR